MSKLKFDELHVVSDLHFGGKPGFQIFNQGDVLAATLRNIANFSKEKNIGFVMNGDIVDFLAEQPSKYLDPDGAIAKLQRIFGLDEFNNKDPGGETAFHQIWCAMQDLVATKNRHLILVLGNHDVELALPPVTEWLKENLSKGDASARGRILVHFDGAGFACTVKDKQVLCVHGNEVDAWNFVNYKQLLEVSQAMNRGQKPPDWDANAGTRLVIDVMNNIKRKYPMVDLLKPEVEAALPIVLALDPGALKDISKLLTVVKHLAKDSFLRKLGFLSTEEGMNQFEENTLDEEQVLADFLSDHFQYDANKTLDADDLLTGRGTKEDGVTEQEFLGPFDFIKALFGGSKNKAENMRKALNDKLEKDTTFELDKRDDFYKDLDQEFGRDMDYLIAGHTHLQRAIKRDKNSDENDCFYFNSGTWIRLIQLTEKILESPEDFEKIWQAFKQGNIEALDSVNDLGPKKNEQLVLLRPTVVSIIDDGNGVFGRLCRASDQGEIGNKQEVPGSRLPAKE